MIAHYAPVLVSKSEYVPQQCATWLDVPCPACGCVAAEPVIQAPGWGEHRDRLYAVVRCKSCGVRYTNPVPRQLDGDKAGRTSLCRDEAYAVAILARYLPNHRHPDGWLFHFGSAERTLIEAARRCGSKAVLWRARLAEVPQAWWFAGGAAVFGSLEEVAAQCQGQAAAITVCNWLEFQASLDRILSSWRRLLAPRGQVLLLVPNLDGVGFRKFNGLWRGLNLPHHRVHFSPETLCRWLTREGWRICSMRTYPCLAWLRESSQRWRQWSQPRRWWHRWFWSMRSCLSLDSLAAWTGSWLGYGDWLLVTAEPLVPARVVVPNSR